MDRYFGRLGSRRFRSAALAVLTLAASCFIGGCAEIGSSMSDFGEGLADLDASIRAKNVDLVAENKVVAQAVSGDGIVVSLPSVFAKRNELEIFGTVVRKPDYNGPVTGFLDVQIRASSGELIDQSLIHWVPEIIPTDGTRSARYSAHVLGVPPAGSIVRVAYVEKISDLEQSLGPPEYGGNSSTGTRGGGGGGRSSGGSGFGSNFGRH
jgi:hypothetical protein